MLQLTVVMCLLSGCAGADAPDGMTGSIAGVAAVEGGRRCADLDTEYQALQVAIRKHDDEAKVEQNALPTTLDRTIQRVIGPEGSGLAAADKARTERQRSAMLASAMNAKHCPATAAPATQAPAVAKS